MKRSILIAICVFIGLTARSQSASIDGSEIGLDVSFSASTVGGNAGLGLKYGLTSGEYFIFGPSVRYERVWSKNVDASQTYGRSIYGGGAFVHARFFNAVFLGAEFEYLKTPFDKTFGNLVTPQGSWAPTLFVGGGFSMEFNEIVRLNAGIMYDVINATNSPFRNSYSVQKTTPDGAPAGFLPIIYRIAFFFPLG